MNVLVINGSPKGRDSVTYQTIRFLQKKFPKDAFEVIHAGEDIEVLEQDMSGVCEAVERADMLLFAYPVYTFMAPAGLHRFISALKAQDIDMKGKYATQITASSHFYDVTAQRYIEDNCRDMGLKALGGFYEETKDLLDKVGRLQIITYWNYIKHIIDKETLTCREIRPEAADQYTDNYNDNDEGDDKLSYDKLSDDKLNNDKLSDDKLNNDKLSNDKKGGVRRNKNSKYSVVIVTDCSRDNIRLRRMIIDFRRLLPYESHVINLQNYDLGEGCANCHACMPDAYEEDADDFEAFIYRKLERADSIVYAFTIKDHSMGVPFKSFDERRFCDRYIDALSGKPTAYIVDGELSREENLKFILEARSQIGKSFTAGVATNEGVGADTMEGCADKLAYALEHRIRFNENFYGAGAKALLRSSDTVIMMKLFNRLMRQPFVSEKVEYKITDAINELYEKVIDGKSL